MALAEYLSMAKVYVGLTQDQRSSEQKLGSFALGNVSADLNKQLIDFRINQVKNAIHNTIKPLAISNFDDYSEDTNKYLPLSLAEYLYAARDADRAQKEECRILADEKYYDGLRGEIKGGFWGGLIGIANQIKSLELREGINFISSRRNHQKSIEHFLATTSEHTRKLVDTGYDPVYHTPDEDGYWRYLSGIYPDTIALLGKSVDVHIPTKARLRHTYVTGTTGSGKTELLKRLISDTMAESTAATVVLDPHGDMVEQIAHWKEFSHGDRLVYIDPFLFDGKDVPTFNPFHTPNTKSWEREVLANQLLAAFEEILKGGGGTTLTVNMRALLMPCILLLMEEKENATLHDLQNLMSPTLNNELVALGKKAKRKSIRNFFTNRFFDSSLEQSKSSIANKIQSLISIDSFANLTCGPQSYDLEALVNQGKVILFNLSKGKIGSDASEAFGRFIIARLQGMALRRADERHRTPVHLVIDECQNFVDQSTVQILTEARKYGLHLTLAQQVAGQGMNRETTKMVINNTNLKFAGLTVDDPRMAKAVGRDNAELQQLNTGVFMSKIANKPAFRISINPSLIDGANAMSNFEWKQVVKHQAKYYRSVKDEFGTPAHVMRELV